MIVVDTNVLAYFHLPGELTPLADRLWAHQPGWAAPVLWRSEFRSVLALYLRNNRLTLNQAFSIQSEAEALLADREYAVDSLDVLRLVDASACSAYDCEFVALAKRLNVPLVTADSKVLKAFPSIAVSIADAVA